MKWQAIPVYLPRESHRQKRLVGYSLWGPKEPDMTEQLTLFTFRKGKDEKPSGSAVSRHGGSGSVSPVSLGQAVPEFTETTTWLSNESSNERSSAVMFIFQITFCGSVSGTKIFFELEKGCTGWDILILNYPPPAPTFLLPVSRTDSLRPLL